MVKIEKELENIFRNENKILGEKEQNVLETIIAIQQRKQVYLEKLGAFAKDF